MADKQQIGYQINDYLFMVDESTIDVKFTDKTTENDYIFNESLRKYLIDVKLKIDTVSSKWDKYKKITNRYEFVNTNIYLDNISYNHPVCSYKSISRSYFKLIEMIELYNFEFNKMQLRSFHLAEGPGGFIEAIANKRNNPKDCYYGFTLIDHSQDIPKWNKINALMRKHKNIHIEYGPNRDGNLYFLHNLIDLNTRFGESIDFITADGGFDFSIDFNKQEEASIKLIFSEVVYALHLQKEGGAFILKVFDIFHRVTVEILYLLSYFYDKVSIYKPQTSREANSEKYVVCIGFRNQKNKKDILKELTKRFELIQHKNNNLCSIFSFEMNSFFLNKIRDINAIYGQQQIENIIQTLNYINDDVMSNKDRTNRIKITNIQKCIQWCQRFRHPYYDFLQDLK